MKQGTHTFNFLNCCWRRCYWLSFLWCCHFVFRTRTHVSIGLWLFNHIICIMNPSHTEILDTVKDKCGAAVVASVRSYVKLARRIVRHKSTWCSTIDVIDMAQYHLSLWSNPWFATLLVWRLMNTPVVNSWLPWSGSAMQSSKEWMGWCLCCWTT